MTEDDANVPLLKAPPIIELTEMVVESVAKTSRETAPFEIPVEGPVPDRVVDLPDEVPVPEELSLMPDDMVVDMEMDSQSQDLVQSLGMEIEPLADLPPTEAPPVHQRPDTAQMAAGLAAQVDTDQIAAALERIITPMVAERIDQILVDVIENAVRREIEKIKSMLLEDGPGDDTEIIA